MNITTFIKTSPVYQSGQWFKREDLVRDVGEYNPKTYSRGLGRMVKDGDLERGELKGYYRRKPDTLDLDSLPSVIEEIDSGRTTMLKASEQFPFHYHTFCKYVRQCRKGVGRFA